MIRDESSVTYRIVHPLHKIEATSKDVVYLLDGLGIATGVDLTKLRVAGQYISDFLGRPPVSRVARALAAKSPLPQAT